MDSAPSSSADVLLVDDDPSGLAILGLALRRAGLSVVSCGDPNAAVAELGQRRFRWLVTDARMGTHDGFSLARAARMLDPELRIIMISALASQGDIQGYPIERLFPKPVPIEALVTWLGGATPPPA